MVDVYAWGCRIILEEEGNNRLMPSSTRGLEAVCVSVVVKSLVGLICNNFSEAQAEGQMLVGENECAC